MFTRKHTHTDTPIYWHAHTHTNLGWLPSCASCFFHQHVFTGRGPLCLHYREAINRKANPGVLKLLFGGGTPLEEQTLITMVQCLTKFLKKRERINFYLCVCVCVWLMFSEIHMCWSPQRPSRGSLMNFSVLQSLNHLDELTGTFYACVPLYLCVCAYKEGCVDNKWASGFAWYNIQMKDWLTRWLKGLLFWLINRSLNK